MTVLEDAVMAQGVPVGWGHESNPAVQVLVVVQGDEVCDFDRVRFERLASEGFAIEVPRVGIVRVPGYYFEGLVDVFDRAKTDHDVDAPAAGQ